MQPPELVNMFAVPFAFSRLQDDALLNPRLRRYILQQESRGAEAANPRPLTQRNAAVFESHFNLFRDNEPAVQELKTFCWDQLLAFIGRLNGYDLATLERLQIYNDCWFHVTRVWVRLQRPWVFRCRTPVPLSAQTVIVLFWLAASA